MASRVKYGLSVTSVTAGLVWHVRLSSRLSRGRDRRSVAKASLG